MRYLTWLGALALLVTACQSPSPSDAPPVADQPVLWKVQMTPALRWAEPAINQCALAQPGAALILDERSAPFLDMAQTDVVLRWGAPDAPGNYAAVVGWDDLVLIVHPTNPLSGVKLADVNALYTGRAENWKDLKLENAPDAAMHAWGYGRGEDLQDAFDRVLLGGKVSRYQIAADVVAMLQSVSGDAGAIGFIPRRWATTVVRVLPVDDVDGEMLRFPLLAMAEKAPQGGLSAWLLCLQGRFQ